MNEKRTYSIWNAMIQRCLNDKHPAYKWYGGRGINVCKRWLIFKNFLKDMGPKPDKLTLDRTNNNKGYNKNNCRWATWSEQANNKRSNVFIEYRGEKLTIYQMAQKYNIEPSLFYHRIKSGYTVDDALKTKKHGHKDDLTYNGITKTLSQWSKYMGGEKSVICQRLSRGWSVEKTLSTPIKTRKRTKKCITV